MDQQASSFGLTGATAMVHHNHDSSNSTANIGTYCESRRQRRQAAGRCGGVFQVVHDDIWEDYQYAPPTNPAYHPAAGGGDSSWDNMESAKSSSASSSPSKGPNFTLDSSATSTSNPNPVPSKNTTATVQKIKKPQWRVSRTGEIRDITDGILETDAPKTEAEEAETKDVSGTLLPICSMNADIESNPSQNTAQCDAYVDSAVESSTKTKTRANTNHNKLTPALLKKYLVKKVKGTNFITNITRHTRTRTRTSKDSSSHSDKVPTKDSTCTSSPTDQTHTSIDVVRKPTRTTGMLNVNKPLPCIPRITTTESDIDLRLHPRPHEDTHTHQSHSQPSKHTSATTETQAPSTPLLEITVMSPSPAKDLLAFESEPQNDNDTWNAEIDRVFFSSPPLPLSSTDTDVNATGRPMKQDRVVSAAASISSMSSGDNVGGCDGTESLSRRDVSIDAINTDIYG
ncbi:hypothetical protein RBB50_012654 [Rhinocladiella similis]